MSGPPIVDWLLERSFGGREAVAVPGARAAGPRGPYPAGVADLLGHLTNSYADGPPGKDQWGFLVGGPGNGKSEALRDLASRLGLEPAAAEPGAKAPREIGGDLGHANVRLVNDASIPRQDRPAEGSLHRDLAEAFAEADRGNAVLFFANVNRGVLVGENSRATPTTGEASLEAECLSWLSEAAAGQGASDPGTAYYARRQFQTGGREVVIHVLSLDATSLFEPQPGDRTPALDFGPGDAPLVAPYAPLGMLQAPAGARAESAAAALVSEIADPSRWDVEPCSGCAAATLCPFQANAQWLADRELRERFLEAARGAEVAAGRRTTYRDLLGLLATAILGRPEPEWREAHPCDWTREMAVRRTPATIGVLAGHRIYAALFPAPAPTAPSWRRRGAGRIAGSDLYNAVIGQFGAEQAAARSAPLDVGFRVVDPSASLDGWRGLREAVLEAAEAIHVERPVARLLSLGKLATSASCELDLALDEAVLETLSNASDDRKAMRQRDPQVRQWRSVLLHRQAGLAGGWLGDLAAIQAWLEAQRSALEGSGGSALHDGLRRLVAPPGGSLRLAPFRPRTRLFEGSLPPRTVLVLKASSELNAELRAVKDSLQFVLRASTDTGEATPIPVDLDLAREATLLAGGRGFTDLPDQAIARIERVQASLLARVRQGRGRLAFHVTDDDGRLYAVRAVGGALMLVPAPAGARA